MEEEKRITYRVSGSRAIFDGRTIHYLNDTLDVIASSPQEALIFAKIQRNILATTATPLETAVSR
jgi:hypothetical protein